MPWKSSWSYTVASLISKPTSPSKSFHCAPVRYRLPHAPSMTKSSAVANGGIPVPGRIMSFMSSRDCGAMADLIWRKMVFAFSSLQLCRTQPKW